MGRSAVSASTAQLEPSDEGPLLVVSAHAADFVWRAGGVIAQSAAAGRPVTIVCHHWRRTLSFSSTPRGP